MNLEVTARKLGSWGLNCTDRLRRESLGQDLGGAAAQYPKPWAPSCPALPAPSPGQQQDRHAGGQRRRSPSLCSGLGAEGQQEDQVLSEPSRQAHPPPLWGPRLL